MPRTLVDLPLALCGLGDATGMAAALMARGSVLASTPMGAAIGLHFAVAGLLVAQIRPALRGPRRAVVTVRAGGAARWDGSARRRGRP